ncbi:MAG: hypothetical protein VB050_16410 [Geobacteraceae bacterium]|nr:hypothetical protein [Geobacteraceae bacterium]
MDNQLPTLNDFFAFNGASLPRRRLEALETGEKMSALKEKIARNVGGVTWPVAFSELLNKIGDVLDIRLTDILVAAWQKYRQIRKYSDSAAYPPGETFLVPLAEHTVRSTHHPRIEILVDDHPVATVDLEIEIALTLEEAILKISDGKIKGVTTGACTGKGIIKCEGFTVLEKETEPFRLPGAIDLGEGIPIGP